MRILLKRLFYFLLPILLLTSCGGEVEDAPVSNLVLGVWNNYYEDTDSLVMTRVFTKEFYSYFTFSDGKVQNERNKQHYQINETYILLDAYTQKYKIDHDTLWITNSSDDQITKYIRVD